MARQDRSKEEFWRRMIARQAGSGLSVRAWCGRHDLSEASFYWWRRRLARRDGAGPTTARRTGLSGTSAPPFVPVRITADQAHAASEGRPQGIEIILAGNRRVRVLGAVDRQALADVLAVLHGSDAEPRTTAAVEATADAGPVRSIPSRRVRSC